MKQFSLIVFLLLAGHFAAHSQNDSVQLQTLVTSLKNLSINKPAEQAYLQLNKPSYEAGDTIWFKAYLTIGSFHQPSALSTVLHVDLIDNANHLVKSLTLKNNNGISAGNIALDRRMLPGIYRIRAYTNWMRNFGDDTFYEQPVPIAGGYNSIGANSNSASTSSYGTSLSTTTATPRAGPDIQFFPESGHLISGVRSKIAFKAIGTNGLGADVSGTIVDNDNQTVTEFKSEHLGMGIFAILPQSGKSYTAKINGVKIPLPKVEDKGFVLSVTNNRQDTSSLNIRVATNDATLAEKTGQSLYLVGQTNGRAYFAITVKLAGTNFLTSVPKATFPTGIVQFTLFAKDLTPLIERLVFITNKDDLIDLKLNNNKTVYNTREGVNLNITAKDSKQRPVQGNFAVAVYHEDMTGYEQGNILTHLLFTGDLKGYVEQPNYYFTSGHQEQLDVLMLTQGYTKYVWSDVLRGQSTKTVYQAEKALSISGTVTDKTGRPVVKAKVSALSLTARISVDTVTDEQGKFMLSHINLTDEAKLVIQAKRANGDRDVNIKLMANKMPAITATNSPGDFAQLLAELPKLNNIAITNNAVKQAEAAGQISESNGLHKNDSTLPGKNDTLKEVIVKQQRNNDGTENAPWMAKASPHSANLNGPGHANKVFSSEQLAGCVDFLSCLLNKIPGVGRKVIMLDGGVTIDGIFYDNGEEYYVLIGHQGQSLLGLPATDSQGNRVLGLGIPIKYMLDGQFVTLDQLRIINTNQVESVEALTSSNYLNVYGTSCSGGLIIVTTKNGTADINGHIVLTSAPGILTASYKGFDVVKEFYVPKYAPQVKDDRTTVYWNPNVLTDVSGNFNIQFFNSDVKGRYKIVIEGISDNGHLGSTVYHYEVR